MFGGRLFVGRRREVRRGAPGAGSAVSTEEGGDHPSERTLNPLREYEHDQDEDYAVGDDRDVGSDRAGQAVAGGHVGDEDRDDDDQEAAPDGAGQGAQAPDHGLGQQRDGQRDREGTRRDQPGDDGEQCAGDPRAGGAHDEGADARRGDVDAVQRGRHVVVPYRPPVAADPAVVQVRQQDQDDQRHQGADPGLPPGQREVRADEARGGEDDVQPLVTAEGPGERVGDGGDRDAEHEGRAREVGPAQPGSGRAYHRPGGGRDRGGYQQRGV